MNGMGHIRKTRIHRTQAPVDSPSDFETELAALLADNSIGEITKKLQCTAGSSEDQNEEYWK
jgi:hypothetical protein